MILVALTGGIGSGKSTVSALLAARGAVVVDADAIVRELQQPGTAMLARLAERFGPAIIRADGELDRPALAAIAFDDDDDDDALRDLNAIVHPAVREEIARRVGAEAATDHVVVVDTPLLAVTTGHDFRAVVAVDTEVETAVERLVSARGMAEADVRARIAKQITREERIAAADRVVDNDGDLAELEMQVDVLWTWMLELATEDA